LAHSAGADIVFAPTADELYPPGFQTRIDVGLIGTRWEGRSRPGHFNGVATVVALLFRLTNPTVAYFGQKDYQQTLIVRQLVEDLKLPVRLRMLPTVRESDGLALSSRNQYLDLLQRRRATILYRALCAARVRIHQGERRGAPVMRQMQQLISSTHGVRLDYAAAVDAKTLKPLVRLNGRVALLVGAWVGRTRLIDNLLVEVS